MKKHLLLKQFFPVNVDPFSPLWSFLLLAKPGWGDIKIFSTLKGTFKLLREMVTINLVLSNFKSFKLPMELTLMTPGALTSRLSNF